MSGTGAGRGGASRSIQAVRPGVAPPPAALALPAGIRELIAGYEVFVALGLPLALVEARG